MCCFACPLVVLFFFFLNGVHRLSIYCFIFYFASRVKKGDCVLDLCCGSGDLAFLLSEKVGLDGKVGYLFIYLIVKVGQLFIYLIILLFCTWPCRQQHG